MITQKTKKLWIKKRNEETGFKDEHKNSSAFPEAFFQIASAITCTLCLQFLWFHGLFFDLKHSHMEFGAFFLFISLLL